MTVTEEPKTRGLMQKQRFCTGKRRDVCCPSADLPGSLGKAGVKEAGQRRRADTVGRAGKVSLDNSHLVSKVANRVISLMCG